MEEKRVLKINSYEYNLLINALTEYRNQLIRENKSTAIVNEVLLRLVNAPLNKRSIFKRESILER